MTADHWFLVALCATALSAFFATMQLALRDAARTRLDEMCLARHGRPATRRVRRILEDLNGHAMAVTMPRILFNLVAAVAFVEWAARVWGNDGVATAWTFIGGLSLAAVLIWVFGLVLPLSIAAHAAERTVFVFNVPIRAAYGVSAPARGLAAFFDEVVRRLAGADDDHEADELEAELLSVVEEGKREGQFDEIDRDMIEAIVDMRGKTVEQIMTPRTEIEAMELTDNLGEVTAFLRESHHSRIPVCEGGLDHVVGVFYVKDLLRWLAGDGVKGDGRGFHLRSIVRPAIFVPETKTVRELLAELLSNRVHIAMVADEYGGTAGLVTMEDIIEEVFGEIQDEYEPQEEEPDDVCLDLAARSALIEARARIDDVNDELKPLGVEIPESEEYDTVGGFVMTVLGRIPAAGDRVRLEHGEVVVLEAEPTRVLRVRLEMSGDAESERAETAEVDETEASAGA